MQGRLSLKLVKPARFTKVDGEPNLPSIRRMMLAEEQRVRQKRKKDGFSVKNHPCAITIPYACCNQARSYLLYSIRGGETEHMRMTDRDSCRIGSIVRLGDCWQVEQLAHHIAYLLFASSSIPRHRQLHLTRSVLSDRDSPLHQ